MLFKDRNEAGEALARALEGFQHDEVVVYALPRGGVPLGVEVAPAIEAPLDLLIVGKLGHPLQPERSAGAVSEECSLVIRPEVKESLDPAWLDQEIERQVKEAQKRRALYLPGGEPVPVGGKTALIVDDGIASGDTMKAAILAVQARYASQVVVAVPVAPRSVVEELGSLADEVVVLHALETFEGAIGSYYQDFPKISDGEVIRLLELVSKP